MVCRVQYSDFLMIKNILWDFDGVILDSMPIREYGFRKIFENFSNDLVERLVEYHNQNGGLSRFHKIKYFYNHLLGKEISENQIAEYADKFSLIMKNELTNPKYLFKETVEFIEKNYRNYNFHIVSGSEHNELNYLCKTLGIDQYFISINGSPMHKNDLVADLLKREKYLNKETIFIGDSINDYEAATLNGLEFYGFNNKELKPKGKYIESFSDLEIDAKPIATDNGKIRTDYTIIFNCSPSLGILDNWLPVMYTLRQKLPEIRLVFLTPIPSVIEQIGVDMTLIKISEEIFDQVVFYSHCGTWLQADSFANAKRVNKLSKINSVLFLKRVFRKLKIARGIKILDRILQLISNRFLKNVSFKLEVLDPVKTIVLFDLHEIEKKYNKDFFSYFSQSYKFSILHGININGLRNGVEEEPVKTEVFNTVAYIFTDKERQFYKDKYLLDDLSIRSYGIPRHEPEWINFLLTKEVNHTIPFSGGYIFVISRAAGETLLLDRKLEYIREIKKISEAYGLKIVVKLHPREVKDNTFEEGLGYDNYGKTWVYSSLHPYFLGKHCKFAISFYSGVPIDMIMLGTPTIERLNLSGISKYDIQTTLIDERTGEPITEHRFFGLVLGASNYEQMKNHVEEIIQNREAVVEKLQKKYLEVFSYTENINDIISNEIVKIFK